MTYIPSIGQERLENDAVTSAKVVDGTLVNADVNAAAAIAYTKLNLANSIVSGDIVDGTLVNADINAAAAIAYSKLNLASSITSGDIVDGTIVNADVNAAAAIAYSKLDLANSIVTGDIVNGTITDSDVNAANIDGTAGTPSLRTLGTGAQQAAAGNHTHTMGAFTFQVQAKSANYTVDFSTDNGDILHFDTSGGTLVASLPAIPASGSYVQIKRDGANGLSLDTVGAELIDGGATYTLYENYESVTVYSNGANYFVI